MTEDIMVLCRKCGNKAPASSMKLDIDEKMVICPDCVKNKQIHKEIKEEVFHKNETKMQSKTAFLSDDKEEKSSKIAHKCTSCGYKFRIDIETKKPRNCPYCNVRVMGF